MTAALAIDLGGTKVEAALIGTDGTIIEGTRGRAAMGSAGASTPEAAAASIVSALRPALDSPHWSDVSAAGIGSAGPLNLPLGAISPINLTGLRDFPIVNVVREASGLDDVRLRLDGTCIALAELWLGAARGVSNAMVFVVSTGVGGGIISDGRVIAGATGNAGHLGQVIVDRVEGSAAAATVEELSSGPHTVTWARSQGWTGSDGEELAAAYAAGDPIAVAAVVRSATFIGTGVVNAATLLDLELAVVGGGFSLVADDYVDHIRAAVDSRAVNAFARAVRVERASLAGDAPLIGAAALVHRSDLLV